jgi:hypothetical protein
VGSFRTEIEDKKQPQLYLCLRTGSPREAWFDVVPSSFERARVSLLILRCRRQSRKIGLHRVPSLQDREASHKGADVNSPTRNRFRRISVYSSCYRHLDLWRTEYSHFPEKLQERGSFRPRKLSARRDGKVRGKKRGDRTTIAM